MKPIIGMFVSVDNDGTHMLFKEYVSSVEAAGGLPVLIAYTDDASDIEQLVGMCDGFCFTGGVDVDPARYGAAKSDMCGEIHQKRDALELLAAPYVLESGKPILGICRGAQLLNVALGGDLYQDISSEPGEVFAHRQTVARYEYSHSVNIDDNTPLKALAGAARIQANSFHHQAIKSLGRGLCVMARADDGVVEALYGVGEQYIRLYQWHPERLSHRDNVNAGIFEDFINAAKCGRK